VSRVIDHVTVRVADRAASEAFYTNLLEVIGIGSSYSAESFVEWQDFSLGAADGGHPVTTGLHLGFAAPSREQVDAFWRAGVEAGYPDDGAPGPRPQYRDDYYGAFLRDPDGNSVEAVHHGDVRQDGVLDHLWIRVADLAASTAFYRAVAQPAGLTVRRAEADRATFLAGGGSVSFVPGPPSRNVHLAFGTQHDDDVRRFHELGVAAGRPSNGAPGERPQYHPGYYAAYVLDPDGNNIEVVNHHR
jgi:catechol 2,3-dioxygenase-like lactoylglutathione lyase family enzyme